MQSPSAYIQTLLGHWATEHISMGRGSMVTGERYYDFCSIHQWKPLPGTTQTLALLVTDLSMTLQPRTIQVCISAVSYLHHMNGFTSPANNNPVIKLLIQDIQRSMPAVHLTPKHQLITNNLLGQMLSQLDRDHRTHHDHRILKAAIVLGFFGLQVCTAPSDQQVWL